MPMSKAMSLFFAILTFIPAEQVYGSTHINYVEFSGAAGNQSLASDTFADLNLGSVLNSGDIRNGVHYQFSTSVGNQAYVDGTVAEFSGHFLTASPGGSFQPGDMVTFSFDTPVSSFGLNFYSASQTLFQLITNTSPQESANVSTSIWDQGTSYFLGLVSDTPFTSVTFTGGYQSQGRMGLVPFSGWTIPRVVYGVASVPLPNGVWLFLSGMSAIIGFSRGKNRPASSV